MNKKNPSSICCMSTRGSAYELFGLLYSIGKVYKQGIPVYVMVDTWTRDFLLKYETVWRNLNVQYYVHLDEFSNYNRSTMSSSMWGEFQGCKAKIMEYALERETDVLFLDADIFLVHPIEIPDDTKELGVSPHFIPKTITDKYGYYNGGMMWTCNKFVPKKWIEYIKTSRYHDQAAIEDLVREFSFFEFGENVNYGYWRVTHGRDNLGKFKVSDTTILYDEKPIICFHTHFDRPGYSKLNTRVESLMKDAGRWLDLVVIEYVKRKKWEFSLPRQPCKSPRYNHKDDSWRELVQLWQKGNSDRMALKRENNHHCWFMGNVLLYDRPTLEWVDNEVFTSDIILMGNGDMKEINELEGRFKNKKVKVQPWIFWPRNPTDLESYIETNHVKKWSQRGVESCFIGNYTTSVQKLNRVGNWGDVIEDFHLTSGGKYKFTPKEYFDRLSRSKYGLCLRGYGKKCHREVECMALGTVPIVSESVSMDYNDSLVEGIHYIRVKEPNDVPRWISEVSEIQWGAMSVACHEWYMKNVYSKNAVDAFLCNLFS